MLIKSLRCKANQICVHQAAKNKINTPKDLVLLRAANGGST